MKNQIISLVTAGFMAATLTFTLASCAQDGDSITNVTNITYAVEGASEESANFKINKAWSVKNGVEDGTVVTRFYDGNEYIAYIGVRSILEEMYKFDMTEASYANGIYTYRMKNAFNQSFVLNVDVRKDTLHLSNYYEFLSSFDKGIDASAKNNGKRPISVEEAHLGFKPVTLELAKYGLKIFGGVDDAYVPLSVFSALLFAVTERPQTLHQILKKHISKPIHAQKNLVIFLTVCSASSTIISTDTQAIMVLRTQTETATVMPAMKRPMLKKRTI